MNEMELLEFDYQKPEPKHRPCTPSNPCGQCWACGGVFRKVPVGDIVGQPDYYVDKKGRKIPRWNRRDDD